MEDRVEFEGKNFTISTKSNGKNQIEIKIENEEEKDKELLYRKVETLEYQPKKEEMMKFHNKALSLLFKILQKDDDPSSKDFEEEDKEQALDQKNTSSGNVEISNKSDEEFSRVCKDLVSDKEIASFLLKNDELYRYINNESITILEDLILRISTTIDFIKDNRDIDKLIGKWNLMIQSEEDFNLFASMINEQDVLIIINDPSIPMGTMLKNNETIREKLIERLY